MSKSNPTHLASSVQEAMHANLLLASSSSFPLFAALFTLVNHSKHPTIRGNKETIVT